MMENLKLRITDMMATAILAIIIFLDDILDVLKTVVITSVVCLVIVNWFFMPIQVQGTSMNPQLLNKSLGFASIISKKVSGIQRFDIVVIKVDDNDNLVKRVIGMPGDNIIYTDDTLIINGEIYTEDFLDPEYVKSQLTAGGQFTKDFEYDVPEGEYFCLGDNRLVSQDSRAYGPFKEEQILAKGIFVIYPFKVFGIAK